MNLMILQFMILDLHLKIPNDFMIQYNFHNIDYSHTI